jgi:hypothetical protein
LMLTMSPFSKLMSALEIKFTGKSLSVRNGHVKG